MKINSFLKVSAIALGLSLANASMAQTAPDTQPTETTQQRADKTDRGHRYHHGDKFRGGHHHHHMKGGKHHRGFKGDIGLLVPGYGPVSQDFVDTLELTDDQKAKIADVKAGIKQKMQERRDSKEHPFAAVAEERAKQLADKKLDPEAMLKERENIKESMQDRREEFTEEWLSVWNDLNDEQQTKVAGYFQEQDVKRAERAEKMKEKKQERKERREQKAEEKAEQKAE